MVLYQLCLLRLMRNEQKHLAKKKKVQFVNVFSDNTPQHFQEDIMYNIYHCSFLYHFN